VPGRTDSGKKIAEENRQRHACNNFSQTTNPVAPDTPYCVSG
jgi:hypothetical protein